MELIPQQYILIIAFMQILSFGSVIYVIKKTPQNHCFNESMKYYKYYFILSFILSFLHVISILLHFPQSFNIQLFLFFLVSYILLLSVDEKYRNKTSNTISFIVLLSYLGVSIIYEFTLFQNLVVHSIGSFIIYTLLLRSALFKAKQLKNIGFQIISIAFALVLLSVLFEPLYLYQDDIKTASLLVTASANIGFVLVIIGFLVQILASEYNVLNTIALTDPLTGLNNRRGLYHLLESTVPSSNRKKDCFSVIAIDIDFFKKVNDTYGHDGGDAVLKWFAELLLNNLRNNDLCARFGGEEFIIVLPSTDSLTAISIAEKLRYLIETNTVTFNEKVIDVTASFGIDTSCDTIDIDTMLKNADKSLYSAKFSGRNIVIHYHDDCISNDTSIEEKENNRELLDAHILLVEDNKTNQLLIGSMLENMGLEYKIAHEGVHAINIFPKYHFDLVLMDYEMPNMNGIETMLKMREMYSTDIPIVTLTGKNAPEDKEMFLNAGMDGYIPKPINGSELYKELKKFLTIDCGR